MFPRITDVLYLKLVNNRRCEAFGVLEKKDLCC